MKEKIEKFVHHLRVKGHERVTFMIIPHGEAHIISLQISKFTIIFAVFIILLVITVSIFSTELQKRMEVEVNQVYDNDKSVYYKKEQYLEKLEKMTAYQVMLKKNLVNLIEMADMVYPDTPVFLTSESLMKKADSQMDSESLQFRKYMEGLITRINNKELDKLQLDSAMIDEYTQSSSNIPFSYSSEVVDYRKLNLDVQQIVNVLSVLQSFIAEREEVQKNLPYYWPIAGGHFTSFYGPRFSPFGYNTEFHLGVDIADATGTPIYAAASGEVVMAGVSSGYGKRVIIKHRFGYSTLYGHMNSMNVSVGEHVYKGELIGRVGETGRATGPHLHFEVRIEGKTIDPLPYLTAN